MNQKPELIIFDIAGTTVRDDGNAVSRCLQAALASSGVTVSLAQVNQVMGYPKPEAIRRLVAESAPDANAPVALIHSEFVARMLDYYESDPAVAPVHGAEEAFRRLRAAGVRVALDTGFSRPIASVILRRLGWCEGETVDATITSDEVERGRPYPDMALQLMERFGIAPASTAKIGDTPSDLQEGKDAGCGWVIGVTESGTHNAAQLAAWPHTHLIGSVADLPSLFAL
jgi:phosphonatase-like hydrolase